jgi:hypothetical protein
MSDKRFGKCKSCCRSYAKLQRMNNPAVRENDAKRAKKPARKEYIKKNVRMWNLNNPDGYRAHYTLTNAVRDGKIRRETCEVCGKKAHAHHDDYAKPLDVRWLCALHHSQHHANLNQNKELA